jgi:hypothetical protein
MRNNCRLKPESPMLQLGEYVKLIAENTSVSNKGLNFIESELL